MKLCGPYALILKPLPDCVIYAIYPEEILIGALHIRQTDNGFKVTRGSCTLEAKPDGLYFNDKKVVLEDTT